jgi:hypothetical protein
VVLGLLDTQNYLGEQGSNFDIPSFCKEQQFLKSIGFALFTNSSHLEKEIPALSELNLVGWKFRCNFAIFTNHHDYTFELEKDHVAH